MSSLSAFQDDFVQALNAAHPAASALTGQRAFAIYRNTVMKGWIDALEANFPAVLALVGEQWFRAAASQFARAQHPVSPVMALYGDAFPPFLESFDPATELPYLAEVAAIDWQWLGATLAPQSGSLTLADIAGVDREDLASRTVRLNPALRVHWSNTTAPSIWLDARGIEVNDALNYEAAEECLVICRSTNGMTAGRLSPGGHRLIERLREGATLGWALAEASVAEPEIDLADCLTSLFGRGAIAALDPAERSSL